MAKKTISTRIEPHKFDAIQKLAVREQRTISNLLNALIDRLIEENRDQPYKTNYLVYPGDN